jgi:hypothetical protein
VYLFSKELIKRPLELELHKELALIFLWELPDVFDRNPSASIEVLCLCNRLVCRRYYEQLLSSFLTSLTSLELLDLLETQQGLTPCLGCTYAGA